MFTGEHISRGSGVFTPEHLGYLDIKKPAVKRVVKYFRLIIQLLIHPLCCQSRLSVAAL